MPEQDKCPSCGTPYEPEATFCINCGAKREPVVTSPAPSVPETASPDAPVAVNTPEPPPGPAQPPTVLTDEEALARLDERLRQEKKATPPSEPAAAPPAERAAPSPSPSPAPAAASPPGATEPAAALKESTAPPAPAAAAPPPSPPPSPAPPPDTAAATAPKGKSNKGCCIVGLILVGILILSGIVIIGWYGYSQGWFGGSAAFTHDCETIDAGSFDVLQQDKDSVVKGENGMLKLKDALVGIKCDAGADYAVECTVGFSAVTDAKGEGWAGVVTRINPAGGDRYAYQLLPARKAVRIEKITAGAKNQKLAEGGISALNLGETYRLKAEVAGNDLRMFLNGQPVLKTTEIGLIEGTAGLEARGCTAYFDDLTVTSIK